MGYAVDFYIVFICEPKIGLIISLSNFVVI